MTLDEMHENTANPRKVLLFVNASGDEMLGNTANARKCRFMLALLAMWDLSVCDVYHVFCDMKLKSMKMYY